MPVYKVVKVVLAAALVMAWMVLGSTNAKAATITVCSSGCDHTTIQAAINAAQPGDVISIQAGTYFSSTIHVSKPVKMTGTDKAAVIIQANAVGGYGVNVSANDVELSGLTIQGVGTTLYGVKVAGVSNFVINNVDVSGYGRSGIDLIGCNNAVVEAVSSFQNGGVGVAVSNSTGVVLRDIATSNNVWGGVGLFTNKTFYTSNLSDGKTGLDGVTLTGVNSLSEVNPLYTELDDPAHVIRNFSQIEFAYAARSTTKPLVNWYQRTKSDAFSFINMVNTSQPGFKATAGIQNLADGIFHVLDTLKIQPAIDLANPGATIYIFPGNYDETAANRRLFDNSGPYQFGLFIGADKPGLTLMGVTAGGLPIANRNDVQAYITTNATNSFGPSGIFIEGDHATLQGVRVGPNAAGLNKTIEVSGDDFRFLNSVLDVTNGSLYVGDWRFSTTLNESHIRTYRFENNRFAAGASIDLANGAGFSGDVANRRIFNNQFACVPSSRALISFSGGGTTVPWYVYDVGGAVIEGNSFTGVCEQYIRARGNYDNSQFNWADFFTKNSFDRAVVAGVNPPANLVADTYTSGSYTLHNRRRVGGTIQGEIDRAEAGNTVLVRAGEYTENLTIGKYIRLEGAGSGADPAFNTIIQNAATTHLVNLSGSGLSDSAPLVFKNIRLIPQGVNGINIGAGLVQFVELDSVALVGPPTRTVENENGLKVATTASLKNLVIKNSLFEYLDYGWYIAKHGDWGPAGSVMERVTVSDTVFRNIDYKAIYAEKLSEAVFTNVTVTQCGSSTFWNDAWNGGIDINLKGQEAYQNLTFNNLTVTNNGLGFKEGAGLMIKARGSGNDSSYSAYPATLSNVTINGGVFSGNERGIRLGEPGKNNTSPTNVVITGATIRDNGKTYAGSDGSAYGDLVNQTTAAVSAENNYWGTLSWYGYDAVKGIKDRIYQLGSVDYIPWSNSGFTLSFVVPNDTYVSAGNVPKAEGEAGSSGGIFGYNAFVKVMQGIHHVADQGTIHVDSGVYSGAVVLPQGRNGLYLRGAGAGNTIIEGVAGGNGFTVEMLAPDSVIEGVTIRKAAGSNYSIGLAWSYLGSGSSLIQSRVEGHLTGIYLASGINGALVQNNLITGNANGILLEQVENNLSILNNEIIGNTLVDDYWVGKQNAAIRILSTFTGAGNIIRHNSISGSAVGVDNNSATPIDSKQNWWGSASGPQHASNPGGEGSLVSNQVVYDPWLCDGTDTQPALIGFQPLTDAAQCTAQYDRLIFSSQPGNAFAGYLMDPQPLLKAVDSQGNLGINFNGFVYLTFGNNPVGGVLYGTVFQRAVNGVVQYENLMIDKAGNGYTLLALSDLPMVSSAAFQVIPAESEVQLTTADRLIVAPFEEFTYELTVQNMGPMMASALKVVDTLPAEVTYLSVSAPAGWTCAHADGKVTCEKAALDSGASAVITITVRAPFVGGVIMTNTAAITLSTADPILSNNSVSQTTVVPSGIVPTGGYKIYIPVLTK